MATTARETWRAITERIGLKPTITGTGRGFKRHTEAWERMADVLASFTGRYRSAKLQETAERAYQWGNTARRWAEAHAPYVRNGWRFWPHDDTGSDTWRLREGLEALTIAEAVSWYPALCEELRRDGPLDTALHIVYHHAFRDGYNIAAWERRGDASTPDPEPDPAPATAAVVAVGAEDLLDFVCRGLDAIQEAGASDDAWRRIAAVVEAERQRAGVDAQHTVAVPSAFLLAFDSEGDGEAAA